MYGNSETVRTAVNSALGWGDVPVADGEVVAPGETEQDAWRAQVQQSLKSIIAKQNKQQAQIDSLNVKRDKQDDVLQLQIDQLKAWHE